eukprot:384726-Hanusia_phi.AAC.1
MKKKTWHVPEDHSIPQSQFSEPGDSTVPVRDPGRVGFNNCIIKSGAPGNSVSQGSEAAAARRGGASAPGTKWKWRPGLLPAVTEFLSQHNSVSCVRADDHSATVRAEGHSSSLVAQWRCWDDCQPCR